MSFGTEEDKKLRCRKNSTLSWLACRADIILVSKYSVISNENYAAIFDFNGSGRLGRERNLYQGGS